MALALLPLEDVRLAAELLMAKAPKKLTDFCRYWRNFWLIEVPPEEWNVFKQETRTNNAVEGNNSAMNKAANGRAKLNFWRFVDFLVSIQSSVDGKLSQQDAGQTITRKKAKYIRVNKRIQKISAKYEADCKAIASNNKLSAAAKVEKKKALFLPFLDNISYNLVSMNKLV